VTIILVTVRSERGGWSVAVEVAQEAVLDPELYAADLPASDVAVAAARQLRERGLRARSQRGVVTVEADAGVKGK